MVTDDQWDDSPPITLCVLYAVSHYIPDVFQVNFTCPPLCAVFCIQVSSIIYHMPMLLFIFDIHILIYSIHIISILYPYCINIISILYPYHILYLSSTSILPKRQGLSARILQRLGPAGDQRPRPGGMASSGFGTNSVARCSMHCIWGFP